MVFKWLWLALLIKIQKIQMIIVTLKLVNLFPKWKDPKSIHTLYKVGIGVSPRFTSCHWVSGLNSSEEFINMKYKI